MIYDESVTYDIMKHMNEDMKFFKEFYNLWFVLVLVIFFYLKKDENDLESGRICTTGDLSLIVTCL